MAANTLWTRDFTLVTVASALGAIGSIAGSFALSFLVFDETGSTLASASSWPSSSCRTSWCLSRPRRGWTACRASPSSWRATA